MSYHLQIVARRWLNDNRPPLKLFFKGTFIGIEKNAIRYLVHKGMLDTTKDDNSYLRSFARLLTMQCRIDGYQPGDKKQAFYEFLLSQYGGDRRAMEEDARETVAWCKEVNPFLETEEEFQEAMREWSVNLEVCFTCTVIVCILGDNNPMP